MEIVKRRRNIVMKRKEKKEREGEKMKKGIKEIMERKKKVNF